MSSVSSKEQLTLQVLPWETTINYPQGEVLLNALRRGGFYFKNACGGDSTCGRCKVQLLGENGNEEQELLACKIRLERSAKIRVPPEKVIAD